MAKERESKRVTQRNRTEIHSKAGIKFKITKCHWSPTRPARFYTTLPEAIRALPAPESSQEMQFLVLVIVRFVKLQDDIVFLCIYALCTVEFKINQAFDFKITQKLFNGNLVMNRTFDEDL